MVSAQKVIARLLKSMDEQRMVQVERKPKYADRLDGFVVGVGVAWALMAVISDGGYFSGFAAFRVRDVQKVRNDKTFQTTFAKTRPEWPPAYPRELDLDTTKGVIESLGLDGGLVGIEKDHERSALWIGVLEHLTEKSVYLHEVRSDGSWRSEPWRHKLKTITTVQIGSHYLSGLVAVTGTEPPRSSNPDSREAI